MSLRTRLTLASGAAVLLALTIASLVVYISVRSKLHDQIDVSLAQSAENVATKILATGSKVGSTLPAGTYAKGSNAGFPTGPLLSSDSGGYFQVVPSLGAVSSQQPPGPLGTPTTSGTTTSASAARGTSTTSATSAKIPRLPAQKQKQRPSAEVPAAKHTRASNSFVAFVPLDASVAVGAAPPYFRDVTYLHTALRLYTMRLGSTGDGLVRTARPLTEANATIGRVKRLLILLTLGGALGAAVLGRLAAAAVLRPVRTLAAAVQAVTGTRDLNQRVAAIGRDEVGSLAQNFNAMLAALEESQHAQQQLIADASHELRTPLTAHRTNVELLARPDLPPERRPQILAAAVRGIEELSTLISDLIQAAREGKAVDARSTVELHQVVERAIQRARHRAPGIRFQSRIEPYTVMGARSRVERSIDNVLDNAIKWSGPAATVEITLVEGLVTVRDWGPGIDPLDLPHVFDRFYRAAAARSLPGSGLGLAIVKHAVDDHGGSVNVRNADGGGAVVSLRFDATVPQEALISLSD